MFTWEKMCITFDAILTLIMKSLPLIYAMLQKKKKKKTKKKKKKKQTKKNNKKKKNNNSKLECTQN